MYRGMVGVFSEAREGRSWRCRCPEILDGIGLMSHWSGGENPSKVGMRLEEVKVVWHWSVSLEVEAIDRRIRPCISCQKLRTGA